MELAHALDQISEIHGQLAKSETFRGYRPLPIALSGVVALAAALAQPYVAAAATEAGYVLYWVAMAAACGALCGGEILYNYVAREDRFARRTTRRVVGQFAPCLAAGVAVTVGLWQLGAPGVGLLPALWTLLYGLGLFSSRPYLPRAIGYVALFYLGAGALLLVTGRLGLSPWDMGATFGLGQVAAAVVLHVNLKREDDRG